MTEPHRPLRGRRPGDQRVVVERHATDRRPSEPERDEAPATAHGPARPGFAGGLLSRLRERFERPAAVVPDIPMPPEATGTSLPGRKLGDRRLVVARRHARYFRYAGPGLMIAKAAASGPTTPGGRVIARIKAVLLGRPLASAQEIEERLSKKKALAIFSSDAISSSAYAVDEILAVLIIAGYASLRLSIAVAAAIALMLAFVAFSYRQLCYAYPRGGGAYVVAKENLGRNAGLIAASALMIDYVMTVAVSTAAAIANLEVAWPAISEFRVILAALAVVLVTTANLRGLRESGNIFALPTYLFIGTALLAIGLGVVHFVTGTVTPLAQPPTALAEGSDALVGLAGLGILLKAFAGGSVALTGTEAIADGVAAFKPPEAKNAANTLIAMASLLAILFIGLAFVGIQFHVWPTDPDQGPTVLGQVSEAIFGKGTLLFFLLQGSAAMILFLAANTSFNAFPRLVAILAQDGFMPRQFSFRGDRLAFSWGIAFLGAMAIVMLFLFDANQRRLIPLYSVGVFVCFTLAQVSLVLRWRSMREAGWRRRALINGFGALLTFTVFLIVAGEKFMDGAWIVLVAAPTIFTVMLFVRHQYDQSARQLELAADHAIPDPRRHNLAIIPIPDVNRAVVHALNVARSITSDVLAIYVSDDPDKSDAIRQRWSRQFPNMPLVIVESPYRAVVAPIVAYLDVLDSTRPANEEAPMTFLVVPEYVARSWWERLLYNQAAKQLRTALLGRPHTAVISVAYRRAEEDVEEPEPAEVPAGVLVPQDGSETPAARGSIAK